MTPPPPPPLHCRPHEYLTALYSTQECDCIPQQQHSTTGKNTSPIALHNGGDYYRSRDGYASLDTEDLCGLHRLYNKLSLELTILGGHSLEAIVQGTGPLSPIHPNATRYVEYNDKL